MALFEKKGTTVVSSGVAECEKKIAELERNKEELVKAIGLKFLEKNTLDELAGSPYEEDVRAIAVIDKEREFQEKRKLAVQGLRKCEKCGNILVLDSVFCNKCGEKLETLFVEEMKKQSICAKCGSTYEEGAMFCTSCGNKLGQE